jgi:hypothetical protein
MREKYTTEKYGTTDYSIADFNMDGIVNLPDKVDIWKPVAGKGTRVP